LATLADALRSSLVSLEAPDRAHRCMAITRVLTVPPSFAGVFGRAPALGVALTPLPCPLEPPGLVELLKHPLCVGPTRRVVLDRLGDHYGREFADQWEFVRFAEEQKLGLDFTSPPKRLGN